MDLKSVPLKGGRAWTWEHQGVRFRALSHNGSDKVLVERWDLDTKTFEYVTAQETNGASAKSVAGELYREITTRSPGAFPCSIPEFPEDSDAYTALMRISCRECPGASAWGPEVSGVAESAVEWQQSHAERTKHRNYYAWHASRGSSRVYTSA